MAGLSPEQQAAFARDGFLVVRGALRPSTVAALLAETRRLLGGVSLADHPLTRFSTGPHVADDYFLTSGDQVRFFLEEAAFGPDGALAETEPARAVNKIGHGLHMRSRPFAALLRDGAEPLSPPAAARALGFRDPRCLQSMVICKPAGVGGAVPPHQDSTFLYTRPPSAVGFWYALEDAGPDNGCLHVLPGSHRRAPVARRLVRGAGTATDMVDNDGPGFPADGPAEPRPAEPRPADADDAADDAAYVPAEVRAGDLVLIHGNLLHKSERNTSQRGRIIYTFHIIEADGTVYDERNWLQPPEGGFTKLYAAD